AEYDRVEPLRILAGAGRGRVGIDVTAAHRLDGAGLATRIAGQTRVAGRMLVDGADTVARLEPRGRRRGPRIVAALEVRDVARRHHRGSPRCRPQRLACRDLVGADKAGAGEALLQSHQPFGVVGRGEIGRGREALDHCAPGIDGPKPRETHGAIQCRDAAFPRRMEGRFVRLRLNGAEPMHAAQIVDRVHRVSPTPGVFASLVPIMLSRVTSSASCSSLQPSVPAGRIGSTMNRVSAVESQTRICVSCGSATPKSSSTPRGSMTALDRYGAD